MEKSEIQQPFLTAEHGTYHTIEDEIEDADQRWLHYAEARVRRRHQSIKIILAVGIAINIVLFFLLLAGTSSPGGLPILFGSSSNQQGIPNIVHFVHLKPIGNTSSTTPLDIKFTEFMAFYTAYYHSRPRSILVWTDIHPDEIKHAARMGNQFTKAAFKIPSLEFKQISLPDATSKGVTIRNLANKSDFARVRVLYEHGGIYMDTDVWTMQDFKSLRLSGASAIFGRQTGGLICPATILARPKNPIIGAFKQLQDTVYDGSWGSAAMDIITPLLSDHTSGLPESERPLILDREVFFTGSWGTDDLKRMYSPQASPPQASPPHLSRPQRKQAVDDPLVKTLVTKFLSRNKTSEITGAAFSVHGWLSGLAGKRNNTLFFSTYGNFTPEYLLTANSSVSTSLLPAYRDAIDRNILKINI